MPETEPLSAAVALAQKPETIPVGQKLTPEQDYQLRRNLDEQNVLLYLPVAKINLTPAEQSACESFYLGQRHLGPVAAAPMVCSKQCDTAFRSVCPLAMIGKEPVGQRCPFEQQYVQERFLAWMGNLGYTLSDLPEPHRSSISSLVTLDLHEKRCNAILAEAQNAILTTRAVRDVDAESGVPICWEDIIHANAEHITQIIDKRRGILRDMELTPEMQTKKKKALGQLKPGNGSDLASRQSDNADKLRRAMKPAAMIVEI